MKTLIISTLPETDKQCDTVMKRFSEYNRDFEVAYTENYKISHCVGCTNCWLKTPGICSVKDDFEMLFKKILKSDCIIFITEAKLGFVSHKMKEGIAKLMNT